MKLRYRPSRLNSLQRTCLQRRGRPQRLKAGGENEPVIAAVNRCATQNQTQNRVFQQSVTALPHRNSYGIPEGMP